jgi:hypothetical protein
MLSHIPVEFLLGTEFFRSIRRRGSSCPETAVDECPDDKDCEDAEKDTISLSHGTMLRSGIGTGLYMKIPLTAKKIASIKSGF